MSYSTKPRPSGHSIQPYRDSHGYTHAAMLKRIPRWKQAGITRVLRHGFYTEQTPTAFGKWAVDVRAAGMDTGAVFGMGQWTEDHPVEAGTALGRVFAHPLCSLGGIDAEGAYDIVEQGPQVIVKFGETIRKLAPDAFIIDQPWPIMNVHHGFPINEFSGFIDEHAPQMYDADFKSSFGKNASPKLIAWSKKSWDAMHIPIALQRPMGITLQGYSHDDNPYDMVECYYTFQNSITWTDWAPWESTLMAMQAAEFLRVYAVGRSDQIAKIMIEVKQVDSVRPMTLGRAIVGVFQKEKGLKVDYKCGYDTMAKMGIKRPGVVVSMFRAVAGVFKKAA